MHLWLMAHAPAVTVETVVDLSALPPPDDGMAPGSPTAVLPPPPPLFTDVNAVTDREIGEQLAAQQALQVPGENNTSPF